MKAIHFGKAPSHLEIILVAWEKLKLQAIIRMAKMPYNSLELGRMEQLGRSGGCAGHRRPERMGGAYASEGGGSAWTSHGAGAANSH